VLKAKKDNILKKIKNNPDDVLADETTMADVIQDSELAVELLKAKGENHRVVTVNGKDTTLVHVPKPDFPDMARSVRARD
jgi:hypothetical protein